MKYKWMWGLCLLAGILLAGCGSRKESTVQSTSSGEEVLSVLLDLSYTFEDEAGFAKGLAEEWNCLSYELLDNGATLYTLTEKNYHAWLKSVEDVIRQDMEDLTRGEQRVKSFLSIEAEPGYRTFTVRTDRSLYTAGDSIYAYIFIANGIFYQDLTEVPVEEIDTVVNFVDENGELIAEMSYHELREDISAVPEEEQQNLTTTAAQNGWG